MQPPTSMKSNSTGSWCPRPRPPGPLPPRASRLRTRVIAPPSSSAPQPAASPAQAPDGGSTKEASGGASPWPSQLLRLPWANSMSSQEQHRVQEALDHMHSAPGGAPVDIAAFLRPLAAHDLKRLRMLASLCSLTYYMGSQVTPRALMARHRVELIASSLACERIVYEHTASAREVADDGDGCCLGLPDVQAIYAARDEEATAVAGDAAGAAGAPPPLARALAGSAVQEQRGAAAAAAAAAAAVVAAPPAAASGGSSSSGGSGAAALVPAAPAALAAAASGKQGGWNPADLVAAKLGEAAAAASAAALAPFASAASAAGSLYAGSLGLVSARLRPAAASAASAAAAALPLPERLAGAAIAGIAGMEVAASHPNGSDVKAASSSSSAACPSEWFVADDARSRTRYFVIQGSDSLDHWRTNLMFEPVVFEDPALGIKVHRGAYEAACALYDRFLPLVQEQAHSHAVARIAFTGHSIGGSMATLLALMLVSRGVLRPDQLAPTVTFGAPAIFCARARGGCGSAGCGGACGSCATPCGGGGGGAAAGPPRAAESAAACGGLLARLGLGEGSVRNVLMTRDIVPRAFSCDYSLVADILRSWGPHWREHNSLNWASRKQMYVHIGRAAVLQPSPALRFASEPPLPLLPPGGGAYDLVPPTLAARMRAAGARAGAAAGGRPAGREAACVDEALAALMDNPHPLETLADPGAYLDTGSISRYHNPANYCRALGRALAERRGAGGARGGAPGAPAPLAGAGGAAAGALAAPAEERKRDAAARPRPVAKTSAR
ncbi:MAG: hypothetical protein J3K34DRAFT_462113 [Monoraphidium minutum]|nr:MAG: hypothetical protein J3K34DRAFT_462113 [Monoraphidium minutum]